MSAALAPHFYVLLTLLVGAGSYALFSINRPADDWLFLPLLVLALGHALINGVRQWRGDRRFVVLGDIHWPKLLQQALARYVVWLVLLLAVRELYQVLPIFQNNRVAQLFFAEYAQLYLWFGLPYFLVTLALRSSRQEDYYDPAIRLLFLARQIVRALGRHGGGGRLGRALRKRYNIKVLFNLLMRTYFMPVMVTQVYVTMTSALNITVNQSQGFKLLALLFWLTALLWMIDILNAALAYCLESRWLDNRSRSIDLTVTGWLVCLLCYEPLNQLTTAVFPFTPFLASNNMTDSLAPELLVFYAFKIIEVALLSVHIYCDVSLGPSVANITLKQLQTRGPYGLVRHPGTTTKLALWWWTSMTYSAFWSPYMMFGLLGWSALYILRALTEERHLRHFVEYRAYCTKVRWRFIPGVI